MTAAHFVVEVSILLAILYLYRSSVMYQKAKHHEYRVSSRQKIKAVHRPPSDPKIRVA